MKNKVFFQENANTFVFNEAFKSELEKQLLQFEAQPALFIQEIGELAKALLPKALLTKQKLCLSLSGKGYFILKNLPAKVLKSVTLMCCWGIGTPVQYAGEGDMLITIKPKKGITETSFANAGKFAGHTDLSYVDIPPPYMTMAAVRQDAEKQGKTIVGDALKALTFLNEEELKELQQSQYTFDAPAHYQSTQKQQIGKRIISFDNSRLLLRCREDKLSYPSESAKRAFKKLAHHLENDASEEFLIEENSLVFLDNWRITHARKAFTPTFDENDRQLLRAYTCANTNIYKDNFCAETLTVLSEY